MALINCPDCGTKVSDMASSCPKCARPINELSSPSSSVDRPSEVKPTEILGVMMVLTPIIATFLFWFWVPSVPLYQAFSTLNLIGVLTILGTGLLAMFEASHLGMGSESDRTASGIRRSGPMEWFMGMVLLWIVSYPAYLSRRSAYGLKSFCTVGILTSIIFVASYWLLGDMLQDQWALVTRNGTE